MRSPHPGGYRRRPEKAIQAAIVRLLRSTGWQVYTLGTTRRRGDYPGTMQTPGLPDLVAFGPDRVPHADMLWIEVKAPGGTLRPAQAAFALCCQAANVPHVIGGVDEVMAWLIERQYLKRESVAHYRVPKIWKPKPGEDVQVKLTDGDGNPIEVRPRADWVVKA